MFYQPVSSWKGLKERLFLGDGMMGFKFFLSPAHLWSGLKMFCAIGCHDDKWRI
jgi:hypothetical protein